MTSRRQFLSAAAVGIPSCARVRAAKTAGAEFPYAEFEARIARRDFRGITKDVLPTPCMVVDLDLFEKNVKTMADHCKAERHPPAPARQDSQECRCGQTPGCRGSDRVDMRHHRGGGVDVRRGHQARALDQATRQHE